MIDLRASARSFGRPSGFFTVEAAIAMVVALIVAGSLARLAPIVIETRAARDRATLAEQAKAAASMAARDLSGAYPDSVRASTAGGVLRIEMAPLLAVGRYRSGDASSSSLAPCPADDPSLDPALNPLASAFSNDRLSIGLSDSCFKSLGQVDPSGAKAGDFVALPGLGLVGFHGGASRASLESIIQGAEESKIAIKPKDFGVHSAGHLFALVGQPITWVCDPSVGALSKYVGYAPSAAQPTAFAGSPSVSIAGISSCQAAFSAGSWLFSVTVGPAGRSATASERAAPGGGRL